METILSMKLLLILVFSSVACFGQTRMLQGTRLANTFGAVITNLTLPNLPITNMLRINAEGAVTNVLIGANMAFDGTTLSSTASGGGGTVGTVINTGASVVSNVPRYTDTTGTNVAPSSVKIDASGNISVVNSISATTTNVSTIKNLVQTGRITLTDAATIATDASLGNVFQVTLAGNRTLGAPTNPVDGQRSTWVFVQDATGDRTLSLNAVFTFGSDITGVTLTTDASAPGGNSANKKDYMTAVYDSTAVAWNVVGFVRGY